MITLLSLAHRSRTVAFLFFFFLSTLFTGAIISEEGLAAPLTFTSPAQGSSVDGPNFRQAQLFSPEYLKQRTYTTSVSPKWIGKTDRFWYSFRTSTGTRYHLVDPNAKTKVALFDHQRLASDLSQALKKPLDGSNLSLGSAKIDEDGKKLSFVMEKTKFELELATGELVDLGEASKEELSRRRSRGSRRGSSSQRGSNPPEKDPRAHRNFSPDRTAYLFVQEFNLYYVEASDEVKEEIKAIDVRLKKEKAEKKAAEKSGSTKVESGKQEEEQDSGKKDSGKKDSDEKDSDKKDSDKKDSDKKDSDKKDSDKKDSDKKVSDKKDSDKKDSDKKVSDKKDSDKKVSDKKDSDKKDSDKKDSDKKDSDKKDSDKKVSDKKDSDKKVSDKKVSDKKVSDKKDSDKKVSDKKDSDKKDSDKKVSDEKDSDEKDSDKKNEKKVDEREKWADDIDESQAIQLTDDGEEKYEFSRRRSSRRGSEVQLEEDELLELLQAGEAGAFREDDDESVREEKGSTEEKGGKGEEGKKEKEKPKSRPSVNWAPDSSAFQVTRRDSRGVAELYLVNSLSEPRPTLEKFEYSLPGEEKITTSEIHIFDRNRKKFFPIERKWKDEGYQNLHWPRTPASDPDSDDSDVEPDVTGSGDELRFLRRDRLLRNVELCSIDVRTGEGEVLLEDGFVGANIAPKSVRYLKKRNEMIWWSERSGWGHFYLHDIDGEFKNAITSGSFRASQIVEVDEDKGLLYFKGNGREAGENIYFQHLYRIFLDGTGLTLMDPGNANHRSVLSPTRNFVLDNCSRIDMAPISLICSADGTEVMELEEADLSRLTKAGWKMPETFTFKAADGVTDLYGNMWKPFDFDPSKKYPIIAEVYPGPQTEGVSHSFSASNGRQQLAQIGFIVVQLGHRGGTPGRSKAYHSYGYFNLRDYGLADKKAGIEQLAERLPFIDIRRVGIFGHSGGGFMTAAALLQEPYNDFFKVGVASSGNHDNNVYGRHWAERYHGLKEVAVKEEKKTKGKEQGSDESEKKSARADDDEQKKEIVKDEGKEKKEEEDKDKDKDKDKGKAKTQFEIHVPTNAELAENLKGNLLLVHGDMDSNVHPAGTMRLVDALIKANKRFDMLILPGKRHGYGEYSSYFTQRKWEFFAEHLLGDHQPGANIMEKD